MGQTDQLAEEGDYEIPEETPTVETKRLPVYALKGMDFEIKLLVDDRERFRAKTPGSIFTSRSENLATIFTQDGVESEVRKLVTGDFMWTVSVSPRSGPRKVRGKEKEYVIDCIVERKTIDDLFASVDDGRYEVS